MEIQFHLPVHWIISTLMIVALSVCLHWIWIIGGEKVLLNIAGEWIVLVCLALYIVISCMKNGIWDRKLKPNLKTNIILSLTSGIIVGIVRVFASYTQYNKLNGSIIAGVIIFVLTFIFTFAFTLLTLTILASWYKKRIAKLEQNAEK